MKNFSQITENLDVANKKYVDDELDKLARTVNNGALTLTVNGTAHTFTANQSEDTSVTINDTGVTSVSLTGDGNAVTNASIDGRALTLTKGTTFLTSQSIKTLNTNNTTAQTTSASEAIAGSGTINLHKVSKTGSYNDLLNKLTAGSNITISKENIISAKDTTYTFTANNPTLAWSTTSKIGTIGGVEFNITMPANPDTHYTNYLQIKGNGTEAVKFTQDANKTLNFKPGANVSISAVAGEITISSTDTNTATAADNILDGSNSGTEITYKPYTSQQSKLSFDTSTTNPTRSDRLNLNGHLHATKLYSGGKEVLTSHQNISGKLDKTTYEWNKEFRAGENGAISLGRYNIYDTQLTFDISSTTNASMNGKLVIATQNGRICQAKVFGDATGVLVSKIVIYQSAIVNNRSWIEVFCNFDGWSKNKAHIYGVALESATVTNQMSSVTFTNGVPSPITSGDSKWSGTIDNDLSVKQNKLTAGSNITISGNTISATDTHNSHAIISGTKSDNVTQIKGSASSGDIILGNSGASAGSYGNASNQEPGYGTTFKVPYITVNAKGIVTAISNKTVKIPASDNTNTATAADNILDGSNSGTEITYAPYTSQQSKLSFDTSTTNPTRTDRLNLNGYLYATKFNVAGKTAIQYNTTEDCIEFIFA